MINEKNTLATVAQLATDTKLVGDYVATMQKSMDDIGRANLNALENHMKAVARRLNTAPVVIQMSDLEKQAARVIPRTTARVKENGYQGWRDYMPAGGAGQTADNPRAKAFADARTKYPLKGRLNTGELQLLINGRQSALEIKYMLDAQGENPNDLQDVINYLEQLKAVGLIEM